VHGLLATGAVVLGEHAMAGLWPYLAILALIIGLYLVERRHAEVVTRLEENILAILLATITLISF